MQKSQTNTLPDRTREVLPQEDPVLFLGALAARAMTLSDPVLKKQLLGDLFFQVGALGGPAGAAAYYQPEVFGGLEDDALELDAKGRVRCTIRNYYLILETCAQFGAVRYNVFKGCFEEDGSAWTDEDLSRAMSFIETHYGIKNRDDFHSALLMLRRKRGYHPIRERIAAIQWDGMHRLGGLFPDLLAGEDTPYTREGGRLLFHCGMARLMEPGCKCDCVVILTGRQGGGKSTLVRFLALEDDWFTELCSIRDEKTVGEQLRGKWFVELGELSAFRTSLEEIKQFSTRQYDRYRQPYERLAVDFPRTCVFVGTTNNPRPLRDLTGNRRFFPIEVNIGGDWLHEVKSEAIKYLEQSWAEAYALWQKGRLQPYVLPGVLDAVEEKQRDALQEDTRVSDIERYLDDPDNPVQTVCVKEIWEKALGMTRERTRGESNFITTVLNNLPGWQRSDKRISSGIYKNYVCWERKKPQTVPQEDVVVLF